VAGRSVFANLRAKADPDHSILFSPLGKLAGRAMYFVLLVIRVLSETMGEINFC